MLDSIRNNEKTDYVPSFRIDASSDGFKYELLMLQVKSYLERAAALRNFKDYIESLVKVNLLINYRPTDYPKLHRKCKWYWFLVGDVRERMVDNEVKDIRDHTYIKHLLSEKQIPHIKNRYEIPKRFYEAHLEYDIKQFQVSKKHPAIVANDIEFTGTYSNIIRKFKDLSDVLTELNTLLNIIQKAEMMFADRIYINYKQYSILQKLDEFNLNELNSYNRIISDAINEELQNE